VREEFAAPVSAYGHDAEGNLYMRFELEGGDFLNNPVSE
jgi:hypothetical protein